MRVEEISIPTYQADGRLPLNEIYKSAMRLHHEHDWQVIHLYSQPYKGLELPVIALISPHRVPGKSIYSLYDIHGEEPAGPNAMATEIPEIAKIGVEFPTVLIPLCNPVGYATDFRYFNERRDHTVGLSVGDSSHLLLDLKNPGLGLTQAPVPSNPYADALSSYIVRQSPIHIPQLWMDHHEDEALTASYIYSQGPLGERDRVALRTVDILEQSGVRIQRSGTTRFNEQITNGVIFSASDGSIDELSAARTIVINGKKVPGPGAKSSLVIETPTVGVPLSTRVAAHAAVIRAYPELFWLSLEQS